jgi:hypothetical protein
VVKKNCPGKSIFHFKMCTHKFMLTFVGATKVEEIEIPGIPLT